MTDLSKVTKDALAADLTKSNDLLRRMVEEDKSRDADARAIDTCVKALDALWKATSDTRNRNIITYSYPAEPPAPGSVERVLAYLRLRYGLRDASAERDALREELNRTQQELESLRRRFGQVYQAVQG